MKSVCLVKPNSGFRCAFLLAVVLPVSVTLLSFSLVFSAFGAQQGVFTFEQLVKMAFRKNLGLKIEVEQSKSQKASEAAAFRKLLPLATFTSGRTETLHNTEEEERETTRYSSGLKLSQPIYQPALWASWKKSTLSRTKADYVLQKKQQSLLFEVKKAWFKVLEEQILNKEARASLVRLRQHQKNAEAFFRSGKIWRNDVLQAHVRVARGEQDVFAASNRLELAKSQINLIVDRLVTMPVDPRGELSWLPFNKALAGLFKEALLNRLELKQGQVDIDLAKQDVALADAKLKPTVNFSISTGASSEHFGYNRSSTETVAAINLSWNFWQWGQTNREVDAAQAKLQVQHLTLAQQKSSILAEVQRAYLTVTESQKSLGVTEKALIQAQENFKVSQIRYKEQLGSSNDVLDAQDLLTQTRNDRTSALSRYLTAIAELNLAIGDEVGGTLERF
jgi:outer membrane protein